MTQHIYMLQKQNGDYRRVSRSRANRAIEQGKAHWVGIDGEEETNTVTYWADLGGLE